MRYIAHYFKWILLGTTVMTAWNLFLVNRDEQMFKAYDAKCARIQYVDPNCRYAK
jgi:hypothetical protein